MFARRRLLFNGDAVLYTPKLITEHRRISRRLQDPLGMRSGKTRATAR